MKEPWLVIADLGSRQGQREERIYLAADFDPALFDSVLAEQVRVVDQLDGTSAKACCAPSVSARSANWSSAANR
jgi:ATP-dependent helicase HrpB